MKKDHLLIINGGSSSLKFSLFNFKLKEELQGSFNLLGNKKSSLTINNKKYKIYNYSYNLKKWWSELEKIVKEYNIKYIGFRLVHGGIEFTKTREINNSFLRKIKKYNNFAPLHNPITLELIALAQNSFKGIKMSVSFDTAWYKDLPAKAYLYSLPFKYYKKYSIRRYGFHGLSHEFATQYTAQKLKKSLKKLNIITCHLGAGNSIAWYKQGKVVDTTMGFSPNEGLTMSTRSGTIPSAIVFYLFHTFKIPVSKLKKIFNKESGLYGLCNLTDLREILIAAGYRLKVFQSKKKFTKLEKERSKIALEVFIYSIQKYLASYLGFNKKLDALVFTGGIGVNSNIIRKLVIKDLVIPKNTKILIAPEGESLILAQKTLKYFKK